MKKRGFSQLLAIAVLIFIVGASLSASSKLKDDEYSIWPFMGLNTNEIKNTVNLITGLKTKVLTIAVPAINLPSGGGGRGGAAPKVTTYDLYFKAEYTDRNGVSYDHLIGGGTCNQPGGCDGDDTEDTASCPGPNYCVYQGECYFGNGSVSLDIDGNDRHQAICVGNTWWDLDSGGGDGSLPTPLPGMEVCELAGYIWTTTEDYSIGEYEWNHIGYGCCGDDEYEFYWEHDGKCHDETEPRTFPIKFLQFTDTHIITGGTCDPMYVGDGRTDCTECMAGNVLVDHVNECSSGTCQWIDPATGHSVAPTIALQNAIQEAQNINYDFAVFTGDNVANQDCNEDNSYSSFKALADNLGTIGSEYYVIGANWHDGIHQTECRTLYENVFGSNMVNWNFVDVDTGSIFVGLSEIEGTGGGNNKYDEIYLTSVLNTYSNSDTKLFLFIHTGLRCNDNIYGGDFRCMVGDEPDVIDSLLHSYKDDYKSIVVISGHNHANIYEEYNGIHYFTTTSTMNYPTEFRIFEVGEDYINVTMSGSVNPAIDDISLEIISGALLPMDLLTLAGEGTDREIYIDLRP